MEEVLVYLVGAGLVVAAPLVPGLRPAVKTAVKGGLVAADATRNALAVLGQTWRDIVKQANEEYQADARSAIMVSGSSSIVIDAEPGEARRVAGEIIDAAPEPAN